MRINLINKEPSPDISDTINKTNRTTSKQLGNYQESPSLHNTKVVIFPRGH
jgi:hypothetical protein